MTSIPIIFIWTLIAIFIFRHHINKNEKTLVKARKKYYNRLNSSTNTRKKPIDDSEFLHLSLDDSFLDSLDVPKSLKSSIISFKNKKMLDFTDIENTDLMIRFGTASITSIREYEETTYVLREKLYSLAQILFDKMDYNDAICVLEECIRLKDNRSKTYKLLFESYNTINDKSKQQQLIESIKNSNMPLKNKLLNSFNGI